LSLDGGAATSGSPAAEQRQAADSAGPIYRFDGWEGPLDLLLQLAREQKVDLAQVSILSLADQYLAFIADLQRLRLEVAADHLVIAAWLAYLKSRLLLPPDPTEEPNAEELAWVLQQRLVRLDAIRRASEALMDRPQIGRDVFPRGAPEGIRATSSATIDCDLGELTAAWADIHRRREGSRYTVRVPELMSLSEALERLERLIGTRVEWHELCSFLPHRPEPRYRRSALATCFVAALELARQGRVDLRQEASFARLYVRPSGAA
jgi:segregation and condensation protein A